MRIRLIKTDSGMASRRKRLESLTGVWVILILLVFFVVFWNVILRDKLSPQPAAHPRVDTSTPNVPPAPSPLP
ncbi:MAG TPA: hypothetical protein VJ746_17700 [Nitrospira sp.]|nr:hypothetical protein [Nitrospira sp.]